MQVEFDWDHANTTHIARHGVLPHEAEEVYLSDPLDFGARVENGEQRITLLGLSLEGRLLVVVVTHRGQRVRVVTCYPADRKYRRFYEQATGRGQ